MEVMIMAVNGHYDFFTILCYNIFNYTSDLEQLWPMVGINHWSAEKS